MTEQPDCPRPKCDRPIHDQGYICVPHTRRLQRDLNTVALVAGEVTTTIARLGRVGAGSAVGADQPGRPDVGTRHDEAVDTLLGWAYDTSVHDGTKPLPTMEPCRHWTCNAAATRLILGPICAHPLARLALWLAEHADTIRRHPDADKAFTELTQAARRIISIVDRPPQRVIVGQCHCGTYLYAIHGRVDVQCVECGLTYNVETSRALLRRDLDERLLTAAEIAIMSVYLGVATNRQRTRNLINAWGQRGLITAHAQFDERDEEAGEVRSEPAYRFGEVVTRLAAVESARSSSS